MSDDTIRIDDRAANTAAGADSNTGDLSDASDQQPSAKKKKGKVPLIAGICAALVVLAFCAWSMSQYVQGKDPLAIFAGGDDAAAVEEAPKAADDAKPASSASSDASKNRKPAGEDKAKDAKDKDSEPEVTDGEQANDAGAAGAEDQGYETIEETSADGGSEGGSSSADGGNEVLPPESEPVVDNSGMITISVTIDGTAGGSNSTSGTLSLPEGSTPYDALLATGADVNARATTFGTYVAAINGLAEKEHGATSGWLYSVNGVEPQTACDTVTLADGDNLVWHYTTGIY